jgi:hypothetical protein
MALPEGFTLEAPAATAEPNMALPKGFTLEQAAPVNEGMPARRNYAAAEVPVEFVKNIPSSAVETAKGIYHGITHPIDTAKTLTQAVIGGVYNVLPESAQKYWKDVSVNPALLDENIKIANAMGGIYKDRYGDWEKIKRTFAEDPVGAASDLSMIFTGGAMATAKVPMVGSALKTAAAVTNPLAPVAAVVQPIAKRAATALQTEGQINAVRDATVRAAQAQGYVVTPGSVAPAGKNVLAERIAGKTNVEQMASVKNQAVTDRLARTAVGLDETAPLTSDAMKAIRADEYLKGYEPIKQLGTIAADNNFIDDLIKVEGTYVGPNRSFKGAVPPEVDNLIKTYTVSDFNSADAVNATKVLKEQGNAALNRGETAVGHAKLDIAKALEDQIERSLANSGVPGAVEKLDQFKASRRRMAISHTIEDAIREGGGSVDAKKLAADIQRGKYMTGDLKIAAEFANVFPRVNQRVSAIGTPGAGTMLQNSLSGMVASAGGAAFGSQYGGTAAAAGALLPIVPAATSALMRQRLLSAGAQANAIPNYGRFDNPAQGIMNPQLRNYLLGAQSTNVPSQLNNLAPRP